MRVVHALLAVCIAAFFGKYSIMIGLKLNTQSKIYFIYCYVKTYTICVIHTGCARLKGTSSYYTKCFLVYYIQLTNINIRFCVHLYTFNNTIVVLHSTNKLAIKIYLCRF